jgi:hypothetical protein
MIVWLKKIGRLIKKAFIKDKGFFAVSSKAITVLLDGSTLVDFQNHCDKG